MRRRVWGCLFAAGSLFCCGCHTVAEVSSAVVKYGASGLEKDMRFVRTRTTDWSTTIWLWTGEVPRAKEEK